MSKRFSLWLILFILACAVPMVSVWAQKDSKKALENRRIQLLKEIEETRKELDRVREKKQSSINELVMLKGQINTRESLIGNYQLEIEALSTRIKDMTAIVSSMQADYDRMREEYARLLRVSYKNTANYNGLLFILSANDFNQAIQRYKYLQQYNRYRKKQLQLLEHTRVSLQRRMMELQGIKVEKDSLKQEEETMKKVLVQESDKKNQLVSELQQNERQLNRELKEKEAASRRLNRAIDDLIRREIAEAENRRKRERDKQLADIRARNKANNKGKNKPEPEPEPEKPATKPANAAEELGLTPEAVALGGSFSGNRGKLPWPVARGFISENFGTHNHPVLKGIVMRNDGINISTRPGEPVRALYKGKVTGIVTIPGMQRVVLIRHGEYLTVYAHLENVSVRLDQMVEGLQTIGTVYTDTDNDKTEVHLQIRKGRQMLNPADWISR